jgi:DNA polymerase III epsilon subunit-like protein
MPFMSEYVNYDLHLYKTPLNGIVCMDIDTLELLRRELENSYTRHLRYLNTEQCTLTLKISQDKYNTVLAHAIKNDIKEYTCTLLLELEYLVVPAHE